MLNQIVVAGRLSTNPVIKEIRGKKTGIITVAVPRAYKNADGTYDTDFIKCYMYGEIANSAIEYLKKGDVVGVKGRLQSENNNTKVIVEKISFLGSHKND